MEPCTKVDFTQEDDVNAIIQTIRQESNIFTLSTEQIARIFLNKCLCEDLSAKSFDEIRTAYIEAVRKEDVPQNADEFYVYILKMHFRYWQEPKTVLAEYYDRAVRDWHEVDERIKKIEDELSALNKVENSSVKHDRIHLLYYYLKHTKIALDEIIAFIRNDMHEFVLRKCGFPKNAILGDVYPYHYYVASQAYNVKQPTMISNKFALSDRRNSIVDMYNDVERKEEFYAFLRKYIEDYDVVLAIRNAGRKNYFFAKREEFLREALDTYENGNYILFSSACFPLIEGILHDVCLKLGVLESEIIGAGFQKKIDKIHDNYKLDIDYQYYSFKFRVLRNEVVHGTANSAELQEIADLLLLDLLDMIEVTKSNHILFNPKLYFLHSAQQNLKDRFEYVVGYLMLIDIDIPDIYDTTEYHNVVLNVLKQDDFWTYIDGLCESKFSYERATGIEVLKKIRNLKLEEPLDEMFLPRLRKYKDVKDKFDLNVYLKGVLQYTYWR